VGARTTVLPVGYSSSIFFATKNAINVFPKPVGRTTRVCGISDTSYLLLVVGISAAMFVGAFLIGYGINNPVVDASGCAHY
jgi:hypothetical protein